MKALIIDDEDLARAVVREHLAAHPDMEVTAECANGFEALKAAAQHQPDLIFLDIQMPKMDGNTVCKQLRLNPERASLYIIMITAKGQEADRLTSMESGANEFMTKPFSPRKVITRVKEILGE